MFQRNILTPLLRGQKISQVRNNGSLSIWLSQETAFFILRLHYNSNKNINYWYNILKEVSSKLINRWDIWREMEGLVLRWIFKKCAVKLRTRPNWLRIRSSCRLWFQWCQKLSSSVIRCCLYSHVLL